MLLGGTANFKEIAAALGCSERTIYRLDLPYILVAGERRAVLALAREKIMANMQRGDPPPPRAPGRPRTSPGKALWSPAARKERAPC
jgi:hypothetical protein